tara:strand:+ start:1575 stop:2462 length:888 start_codon:yes stop_codon:yes gene_type:complete
MELDFSKQIQAGRSGPKSAAQTPAEKEEQKRGSSVNEPGSAAGAITFSEKVTVSLQNKVKEHNAKSDKKATLGMLKKIYRRGAGAFSTSHRPGQTRGSWAMARVNMFLKMMSGGNVKDSYRKADQDVANASEEEISNLTIDSMFDDYSKVELALAKIDLLASKISNTEILEYSQSEDWECETQAEKESLNKIFRLPSGSNKKFGVYVKNDKGNVVKVTFGDPNMEIKRDDPERRKSFRARHQCDSNPGPKWKARYWSCRQWRSGDKVEGELESDASLIEINQELIDVEISTEEYE